MAINAFRQIRSGVSDLAEWVSRNLDEVEAFSLQLEGNPLVGGRLLESVTLSSGDNILEHKLNRVPQGWLLVSPPNGVTVTQSTTSSADDTKFLVVSASGAATASFWVF